MSDRRGFSQINGIPFLSQRSMTFLANAYNLLAARTLIFATPRKLDKPIGSASDLSGTGCIPFLSLCRLGTGISRALDAVPHGGASITASTLSSSIHCKTVAWPSCFDKSTFATGPLTLLLSIMWSIPRASPPIALNAAATPAVPQNKSKRKSCFECVVAFDPARPSTS